MFRANLIEDKRYYKLKWQHLWLTLVFSIFFGLVSFLFQMELWLSIVLIVLYAIGIRLMAKNQGQIKSIVGNQILELDEKSLTIKSINGVKKEVISLDEVEAFYVKDDYAMPQETFKEFNDELAGKMNPQFFYIQHDGMKKFEFEFDSYYMVNQLKKLIRVWREKGYRVKTIDQMKYQRATANLAT